MGIKKFNAIGSSTTFCFCQTKLSSEEICVVSGWLLPNRDEKFTLPCFYYIKLHKGQSVLVIYHIMNKQMRKKENTIDKPNILEKIELKTGYNCLCFVKKLKKVK